MFSLGWATSKWKSSRPTALPIILESPVEMTTSQRNDRVGATNRPEHAGLFQAGTDDSLASGFDHPRADEQVLTPELRVSHTFGISLKVVCLSADLIQNIAIG